MTENLFIIGNGFDLGHSMPTSYNDFKKWIIENYREATDTKNFSLDDGFFKPDGSGADISDGSLAAFLYYSISETIGDDWVNFEEALGRIDWEFFYNDTEDVLDRDGEINYWKTAINRENTTSTLKLNSSAFYRLFSRWINAIDSHNVIPNEFLIAQKNDSIFLTFNYTTTLEKIYSIPSERIWHIHGLKNERIIIGHGIDNQSDYDFGMEGIDDIHKSLRKPSEQIILECSFFKKLPSYDIKNIFSWGFSFSDVDLCYIQEICRILNTPKITWHLYEHRSGEQSAFREKLIKCGFKGTILSFKA